MSKTKEFLDNHTKTMQTLEAADKLIAGEGKRKVKEEQEDGLEEELFWQVLLKKWEKEDAEEDHDPGRDLAKCMIHVHCDLMMFYLQTRQHHWHVQGPTFRDIHLMFDEATDTILGCIDPLAERTVALGAIVPTNPETFMAISDIPLLDENCRDAKPMLIQSLKALAEILDDLAELNDLATEQRQTGIVNMVGGFAEDLEVLVYKYQQFLAVFGDGQGHGDH